MIVIPTQLRKEFGMEEGSIVIVEESDQGVLLRPAVVLPTETYSPQRKAEFLLSNTVDAEDYQRAVETVQKMGLDPAKISHHKPSGR